MIIVLTYDTPHRKTQDTLFRLKAMGYLNVTVIATPFKKYKQRDPIYQHRPGNPIPIPCFDFASRLGYYFDLRSVGELRHLIAEIPHKAILICGAGILPEDLVTKEKIINSHPGWLPFSRGLDALKWAILNRSIIGVTTHIIGPEADTGILIDQKMVPHGPGDTFHSIAYRQYEMEIEMLVEAVDTWEKDIATRGPSGSKDRILKANFPAMGRMSREDETRMIEVLNERLKEEE